MFYPVCSLVIEVSELPSLFELVLKWKGEEALKYLRLKIQDMFIVYVKSVDTVWSLSA